MKAELKCLYISSSELFTKNSKNKTVWYQGDLKKITQGIQHPGTTVVLFLNFNALDHSPLKITPARGQNEQIPID